jgi:hypothetical protein
MLSIANEIYMLNVIMLNVVMLSLVFPMKLLLTLFRKLDRCMVANNFFPFSETV